MAGEDKTLKDTLKEVVGETQATPNQTGKAPEGISQSQAGETKTGETPVYVSGIDISDIPVADRPRIKELLEKKGKLLETGYQEKFKEIAVFKRAQEELVENGLSVEEAKKVLSDYVETKKNPKDATSAEKKTTRLLDKLIEEAPLEQRASLQQLRQIMKEETGSDEISKKVSSIEQALSHITRGYTNTRLEKINSELQGLSDRFGKDFVEKYREVVTKESLKYDNAPTLEILKAVVPYDEFEQAILAKKSKVQEKIGAISSPGSGVTSSGEEISTKGKWKDTLSQIMKIQR